MNNNKQKTYHILIFNHKQGAKNTMHAIVPLKSQIIAQTLEFYRLGNTQGALQGLQLLNPNWRITTMDVFHAAMQKLQAAYGCNETVMQNAHPTQTSLQRFLESQDNFQRFEPHYPKVNLSELALQASLNRDRIEQNFIRGKFSVSTFEGGHRERITCFSVSEGKLISASRDWTVKIWDLKTQKCVSTLEINGMTGKCNYDYLEFIKIINGKVYGGDTGSRIYSWDPKTQKLLKILDPLDVESQGEDITCITDFNGDLVAVNNTEALIFSSETGEPLKTFVFPEEEATLTFQTVFSGKVFLGYEGGLITVWDLQTEKCVGEFPGWPDEPYNPELTDDRYDIRCFAHSNQLLIAGLNGGAIRIYDWHAGKCLHTFQAHKTEVYSLKVYQNWLFSVGYDGMIKMWDLRTAQCLNALTVGKPGNSLHFEINQGKIYIADGKKITVLDFTMVAPHL